MSITWNLLVRGGSAEILVELVYQKTNTWNFQYITKKNVEKSWLLQTHSVITQTWKIYILEHHFKVIAKYSKWNPLNYYLSKEMCVCWWAILTVSATKMGSPSFRELVASCISFPTRLILLKTEFYNSRYS